MIKADTPCIWEIKKYIGSTKTKAAIVFFLAWLAQLVGIERNLTSVQINEIAEDIMSDYGYLKVEELKYLFKRFVKNEPLYGRLDYNVVMNWIKKYDIERTEIAIDIFEQEESEKLHLVESQEDAYSYEEYLEHLDARCTDGEVEALRLRSDIDKIKNVQTQPSKEEQYKKELEFKQWLHNEYLNKVQERK